MIVQFERVNEELPAIRDDEDRRPEVEEPEEKRAWREGNDVTYVYFNGSASLARRKKVEDRELKLNGMSDDMKQLFMQAIDKEWDSWLRYGSVRVLSLEQSLKTCETTDPRRILRSDMKLKDKNASLRSEQSPLPVLAKARFSAQGQFDPDARKGLLKTDAHMVQRCGFYVFLQLTVNLGWLPQLRIGDISAAFLQGRERQGTANLYLEQPKCGLLGLDPGQLLLVVKGIYGLPNAPRAWFEAFAVALKELGLAQITLDVPFFVYWNDSG